jgi:CheY-like chemotaxis protein
LVVDDDRAVRDLTERFLRRLGWEVETVPTAHDALRVLRDRPPIHFLLVDRVLPDMDGPALLHDARRDYQVSGAIISGYPDPGDSPVPWLQKPFRPEQLGALMAQVAIPEESS